MMSAVRTFVIFLIYKDLKLFIFLIKREYSLVTNSNFSLFAHGNALYIIQVLNMSVWMYGHTH